MDCVLGKERSYRVTPGEHTLVVEEQSKETQLNRYAAVELLFWLAGSFALDRAGQPVGGSPPATESEITTYSYVTNTITVEAGRMYLLEGPKVVNQTEASNRRVDGARP
jgi:hypothetical protein